MTQLFIASSVHRGYHKGSLSLFLTPSTPSGEAPSYVLCYMFYMWFTFISWCAADWAHRQIFVSLQCPNEVLLGKEATVLMLCAPVQVMKADSDCHSQVSAISTEDSAPAFSGFYKEVYVLGTWHAHAEHCNQLS